MEIMEKIIYVYFTGSCLSYLLMRFYFYRNSKFVGAETHSNLILSSFGFFLSWIMAIFLIILIVIKEDLIKKGQLNKKDFL